MIEIQAKTPVKDSVIWSLLARFYADQGPAAWQDQIVPQGATANCYTADTYAAIVAAFLRDAVRSGDGQKPLIIELGGGSGRFAWQFLNRLCNYHFDAADPCPAFTYLLTDAMPANLANWKAKPRFQPLIANGMLEYAELRVEPSPIIRMASGDVSPADIAGRPTIIIANYLLDSIPSDLYRVRNHAIERVLVSIETDDPAFATSPVTSFASLTEAFESIPLEGPPTGHAVIDDLLEAYALREGDFHVCVPETAFRFLESFMDRTAPLMLIAGGLGYGDPDDFQLESPFIFDSYFAHYSNYHMLGELFRKQGGAAQFQRQRDNNFCCAAMFRPGAGNTLPTVAHAAREHLKEFNPYDAHELSEMIRSSMEGGSVRQALALMRFSRFDPVVAEACLPMIFHELEQGEEKIDEAQVYDAYMESYRAFFPDGSDVTIDSAIAQLCLALKYDDRALELIESAIVEFGPKPARAYVRALALLRLERADDARQALLDALALDGGYGPALRLFEERFGAAKPTAEEAPPFQFLRVPFSAGNVLDRATAIFDRHGAVVIDQLVQPALVADLRGAFDSRIDDWKQAGLGKPNNVGDKRFTVPIRMRAPFNDPSLYANPVLLDLLAEAMGDRPVLNAFGAVVTQQGARMQHVHREHPLLFSSDDANRDMPTYAVTVLIPLIDLSEASGGTQLWEGTHRLSADETWKGDPTIVYTPAGSSLVFDYRVYHGGMACSTTDNRPLLYLTYSLPWFVDTLAFESHAALGLSAQDLAAIPEAHRYLFKFAKRIPD